MIRLASISKTYIDREGTPPALHDINISVAKGEIFGIIGASGAGKSTLVRLVNLLERPTSGDVFIDDRRITYVKGAELHELRRSIGMVFQHFNLLNARTVAANVSYPLQLSRRFSKSEINTRVTSLLERVGLADQAHKYPRQLSGGQKQRVGIARALACNPKVLLCDEATSALDPQTTVSVLDLLAQINRELGVTILLITHEMDVIRRTCDRVVVLDKGSIVEQGPVVDVFLHPKHSTTVKLVREAEPDGFLDGYEDDDAAGRKLRLTFVGENAHAPILSRIARKHAIDFAIAAGRIGHIRETRYAQFIVSLTGRGVEAAIADFKAAGVNVEALNPANERTRFGAVRPERALHVV